MEENEVSVALQVAALQEELKKAKERIELLNAMVDEQKSHTDYWFKTSEKWRTKYDYLRHAVGSIVQLVDLNEEK
jgi:hypothetical protein